MKMKTAMAAIAFVAVMAFASMAVLENNVSDADPTTEFALKGYGESGTPTPNPKDHGDVQAFYYENGTKNVLKITLPADPKCDVSVSVNDYTNSVIGESKTAVKVVRSSTEIMVYTDDLTDTAAKNYMVTVTPLAGGDAYSTPLTTNPAGYVKVSFDANTGTVADGEKAYVEDYVVKNTDYKMPKGVGTYVKGEDYKAGNWSVDKTSKADLKADEATITGGFSEDTTFYVMWAYEITFNGNGGEIAGTTPLTEKKQTEYFGVSATLDANTFVFKEDFTNEQEYAFYKWSDAADDMDVLTEDGAAAPGEKHTYYAIWTYTIEFNNDAAYVGSTYAGAVASGSTASFPVYLGTALIGSYRLNINGFEYTHLDYIGWALAPSQTEKDATLADNVAYGFDYKTAYVPADHKAILYAVWAPYQYEVTITGLNADVKYFAANTYGENPTYDPAEGKDVTFDANGKATFIRDDTASPKTKGVTYWDKFEISAHGNYKINSVFYTINGVSTLIPGDSSSPVKYVFTKVLTDDAVITISDKKAYSIYGHVTKDDVTPTPDIDADNDDMKLTFNDIIFDGSSGLLIINKEKPVNVVSVKAYDYQKFVAEESAAAVEVGDVSISKIADSRYKISFEATSDAYCDVVIVVTYGPLDKPYTDFYVSDAQNNGADKAKVTVTLRSASDAEFEIAAGFMKIYGTYFNTETLGGSPVAVYGALDGTEFEMKPNSDTKTLTPTIVFEAAETTTNIYWVYAEYTYGSPAVTDATEGVLVVQTYDVTMTAETIATVPVTFDADLVGSGTYIAGSTVTLKAPKSATAPSGTVTLQTISVNGTDITATEVGTDKVYTFIITEDATVVVKYQ